MEVNSIGSKSTFKEGKSSGSGKLSGSGTAKMQSSGSGTQKFHLSAKLVESKGEELQKRLEEEDLDDLLNEDEID